MAEQNLVGRALAGRYKLLKLIGAGGMGAVYQGHDQQMSNRVVAVKVLAPHLITDEKQIARFEQEARAASQLRHPNSIGVLDFGQSDGYIYMVLEYLTGDTLTGVLRRGRVEPQRALYMMRQICKSLAEAHSKGIIHRDLKPDNIFVCEIYGEKDFIKVIDFGIAKFLESGGQELTQAGKMFGTPRYLSPEQAQGLPLAATSDLYALGVILFEMLCGRPPFVAEDPIAVAIKHVQEQPPSFAEVAPDMVLPDELDRLVFKLLAKKPAGRYQNAEEVIAAIDVVLVVLTGTHHPSGAFTPVSARTPARPGNAVPRRSTVPPPSLGTDPESTRAMDSVAAGLSAEPALTMALDQVAHLAPGAAPSQERTMALDTAAAQGLLQPTFRAPPPRRAPEKPAAVKDSIPSMRNLLILLILAVLAGVAVVAVGVGSSAAGGPKLDPVVAASPPVQPESTAEPAVAAAAGNAEPAAKPAEGSASTAQAGHTPPPGAEPTPGGTAEGQPGVGEGNAKPGGPGAAAQPAVAPLAVAPGPTEYEITVDSTPVGAAVLVEGIRLGTTPYKVKLKEGDDSKRLVLKLDEFEDYTLETSQLLKAAQLGATAAPAVLKAKPKAAPKAPKKPKPSDWM
ncbi:MAG: serine/threonine protein kinase [Myxococcales bacterium]|nr:serine/threonine protein kinase [Myxococcales bacterium]